MMMHLSLLNRTRNLDEGDHEALKELERGQRAANLTRQRLISAARSVIADARDGT